MFGWFRAARVFAPVQIARAENNSSCPYRHLAAARGHLPMARVDIRKWSRVDFIAAGLVGLVDQPSAVRRYFTVEFIEFRFDQRRVGLTAARGGRTLRRIQQQSHQIPLAALHRISAWVLWLCRNTISVPFGVIDCGNCVLRLSVSRSGAPVPSAACR